MLRAASLTLAPLTLLLALLGCASTDATPAPEPGGGSAGTSGPLAHGGSNGSATETNVAPIRCDTDADCGAGGRCARVSPDDLSGTCMRGETGDDEDAGAAR